jgi:hypothetical protein
MPHFKVRVVFPGACLYLASWDQPVLVETEAKADWIDDPDYGDSIGFVQWNHVVAVTWRWHG